MEVILILLPLSLFLGIIFIVSFTWMAKTGQYDDVKTPKYKMLLDDKYEEKK